MNGEQILTEALITCSVKAYAEDMGEKIREESERISDVNNQHTDKDVKRFMKLYDKERRKHKRRSKKIIFYRITAVAATLLLLFDISMFTVPAIKDTVLDFIAVKQEKYTSIKSKNVDEKSEIEAEEIFNEIHTVTYVPNGYKKAMIQIDSLGVVEEYRHDDGTSFISFSQNKEESMSMNLDTENAKTEYVDILGEKALIASKEQQVSIVWKKEGYFYCVFSLGISREEAIKVAQSVKRNTKIKY